MLFKTRYISQLKRLLIFLVQSKIYRILHTPIIGVKFCKLKIVSTVYLQGDRSVD